MLITKTHVVLCGMVIWVMMLAGIGAVQVLQMTGLLNLNITVTPTDFTEVAKAKR